MSDIRDFALLRSKTGNLELIPLQVEDADTAEPMALTGRNGALLVDVLGIESVSINLAEGESLPVEIQNATAIPVSLPEGNVSVEFPEAQEVKNASGAPIETVLQYIWGATIADWKPRSGTATITVATDASNSDVQAGYGMDLLRFLMPTDPVGTAFKIQICSTVDGTFIDLLDDSDQACSFPANATNKGKWVNLNVKAPFGRGLFYFRFVSNATETADQSIEYQLG